MKFSYGVKNLRSLQVTPSIELRPITILVGRNSAGKSTFLRSFSLLRQSLEVRSSAPVLWYGDYVDFGDFEAAVHNNDTSQEITFDFSLSDFEVREAPDDYYYVDDELFYYRGRKRHSYKNARLSISLGDQSQRTVRRNVQVELPDYGIVAKGSFEKNGRECNDFTVNGFELSELMPGTSLLFGQSNIFDKATFLRQEKEKGKPVRRIVTTSPAITRAVSQKLREQVDRRITDTNVAREARRILGFPRLDDDAIEFLANRAQHRSFKKLYERWSTQLPSISRSEVDHLCALDHVMTSIGSISSLLTKFFRGTTYLGPARARSERYYRSQELEIEEISPDGQNLPMFLASLSDIEQKRFSRWVDELFGFGVNVQRKEGHVSIQLDQKGMKVNVADTGYGVSQILPVLAQIWWATQLRRRGASLRMREVPRPITMEQPELHLHPAHQAKLAEVLVKAVSDSATREATPLVIVETHSESLINHLGELIERREIKAEDVQIVVFSNELEESLHCTSVEVATFDDNGILNNWPYGFFNY